MSACATSIPHCARSGGASGLASEELKNRRTEELFRRKVKIDQIPPEPARLPRSESDSHQHPDRAQDLCWTAQIDPQQQAHQKSQQRRDEVGQLLFLPADVLM